MLVVRVTSLYLSKSKYRTLQHGSKCSRGSAGSKVTSKYRLGREGNQLHSYMYFHIITLNNFDNKRKLNKTITVNIRILKNSDIISSQEKPFKLFNK